MLHYPDLAVSIADGDRDTDCSSKVVPNVRASHQLTAKYSVETEEREDKAVDLGAVFGKGILAYTLNRCTVLCSFYPVVN
jgi:hypothetical protein